MGDKLIIDEDIVDEELLDEELLDEELLDEELLDEELDYFEESIEEKYGISSVVIYQENIRAIKENKIGILTTEEIKDSIEWWLKNGLDENGNKVDDDILRDPYSGLPIINESGNKESIVLEHIIPINRGGGTLLPNCLPSRTDVNSSKRDNNPLEWWTTQKEYWHPKRFEVFVDYLFYAYDKLITNKKITNEMFISSNDFAQTIEPTLSIEETELKLNQEVNFIPQKKLIQPPKEKLKYDELLIKSVTILENINSVKAKIYQEKIKNYNEIFENIEEKQLIQTKLFNVISNFDSSIKYKVVMNINFNYLIESLKDINNIDLELTERINTLKNILLQDNSSISLSDLIYRIPNILTLNKNKLIEKILIIKNYFSNSNKTITIFVNNPQLLLIDNSQIVNYLNSIKNYIPEYFELFINSNMYYNSINLINYISNADVLSYDLLKERVNTCNQFITFKGSMKGTLNNKLSGVSSTYQREKNKQITKSKISQLINHLYNTIDFTTNSTEEDIKTNLKEYINQISDEELLNEFEIIGDSYKERRDNLLEFMFNNIEDGTITTYLILQQIYDEKVKKQSKEQYKKDLIIIKTELEKSQTLEDLKKIFTSKSFKKMQLQQLTSFYGSIKGTLNIKLSNVSGKYHREKNKLIAKSKISQLTNHLYKNINFTTNPTEEVIKTKLEEYINQISDEELLNKFEITGYSYEERRNNLLKFMFNNVEDGTITTYLLLQQIYDTKQEQLKKIEKTILDKKSKEQYKKDLNIIKTELEKCQTLEELKKIFTTESFKKMELQQFTSFNHSIKNTLNNKLSNVSKTYHREKKLIAMSKISQLTDNIDFITNQTEEDIKTKLEEYINKISDEELLNEFEIIGDSYEERRENLLEFMFNNIDDGTITTYLILQKMYDAKQEQLKKIEKPILDKKSKDQYRKDLVIIKTELENAKTLEDFEKIFTQESFKKKELQQLTSFYCSMKNTLNTKLSGVSSTYHREKNKRIAQSKISQLTNHLYKNINFTTNPTEEVIKTKLEEYINQISDEELLNEFEIIGDSYEERRENLLEFMFNNIEDGTTTTYLLLQQIYDTKQEQLKKIKKTILDKKSKEQYKKDLNIIKTELEKCQTLEELKKIFTTESFKKMELQQLTSFKGTIKTTLNNKLSNVSKTYHREKKLIAMSKISQLTNYLYNIIDFTTNPKEEDIKTKLEEYINKITAEELLNEFEIIGESYKERRDNLLEFMFDNVENGTISTYLILQKMYDEKLKKQSKEEYNKDLIIIEKELEKCQTLEDLKKIFTPESFKKMQLQQLTSFNGTIKTTLNTKLSGVSSTYHREKKLIAKSKISQLTDYLYNTIDFTTNPKEEDIKTKLKEYINKISDEELLNKFEITGDSYEERRNNLIEFMFNNIEDGTISTYLELQELFNRKTFELNPKEKFTKEKSTLCEMFGIDKNDKDIKRIPYLELKYKLIFLITNKQKIIIDGKPNNFLFTEDNGLTNELINRYSNIEKNKGRSA